MNKRFALLYLLLLLFLGFIAFKPTDPWHLRKFENGISIYTRDAEDSEFKELKSVFQMKTSLSSIISLLNDYESYPQWVYKCGKSSTLKKVSDREFIHYQTVTAPWPVDNRDFVVDVKLSQDASGVVHQKATCIPDYIPKVDGHVRITEFRALWTLTPLKDGTVNIEYQLLVNPGGNIPVWLVNLAVIDGPFETAVKMKEWLKKDKYQKASVSFIKEPE